MRTLISKYNVPAPRYTSYPTVPYWDEDTFDTDAYKNTLIRSFEESNASEGISLYIHLPFCESLCTFCACHKRITRRHEVEAPYINAVLQEFNLYVKLFEAVPRIREIHLGGGTPSFFSPENLEHLLTGILSKARLVSDAECSFEGHPNNTTRAHLETLYKFGFRRVSFGVQDYAYKVQDAINRLQPYENVAQVTGWAKELGYTSVSHDLVFGLPFQELEDIRDTIDKTNRLAPDRIAFYSYAHVPWIKGNGQRGFRDEDVPRDEVKRSLYETGKSILLEKGYVEIGMDHFAKPTDSLYKAYTNGRLHRNFMGYTSSKTQVLLGLGVSAISDSWYGFAQNEKRIEDYYDRLGHGELPIFRGHLLTEEDLIIRRHILNLMCRFETSWGRYNMYLDDIPEIVEKLDEMERDQLIEFEGPGLRVTDKGKAFIRNICMAFDLRLQRKSPASRLFSMSI